MTRRRCAWGIVLVAAAVPLAWFSTGTHASRTDAVSDGGDDPEPTPGVRVALHLEEPIAVDRSVVWTAAFQAVWDALGDQAVARWHRPLELGPPARPEDVRALAQGRLTAGTVDPADLTLVAGPATEAAWSAVDASSLFDRPREAPPPDGRDLVAFARLRASIRYTVPFVPGSTPLRFGAERVPVRGYGFDSATYGEEADRVRAQASFHLRRDEDDGDPSRRAVVVLTGSDGKRVVVSGRSPKATLRETWNDVAAVIRSTDAARFSASDRLAIPRVAIRTGRSYDEIAGAPLVGTDGGVLAVARQEVSLVADEHGAEVDAEALAVATGGMSHEIVIDGPFLLAMLTASGDRPYALAWIGSVDALARWEADAGRPLGPEETSRFVGEWTLDREASIETMRPRAARSGFPGAEASVVRMFRSLRFDLSVTSEGRATVVRGSRDHGPVPLHAEGRAVVLVLPLSTADDETGEPVAGEERLRLSRVGERLRLDSRHVTLVLRRR